MPNKHWSCEQRLRSPCNVRRICVCFWLNVWSTALFCAVHLQAPYRFARFLPPVCNCKGNHASDPDWSCLVASEIKWVSQLWQLVWSNRFHPAKKYWIIGWQPWNISLASTQLTHKNSLSVDSIVTYSKTVDDDIVFVSLQTSKKQKDVGVAVK